MADVAQARPSKVQKEESPYWLGIYDPRNYIPWSSFDLNTLIEAEKSLLSIVKAPLEYKCVKVRPNNASLNTITARQENQRSSSNIPFVLVHDTFLGVGIWNQNLDSLSKVRVTHAFDLPGWGRSTRASFSADATLAELEYVQALDDWRKGMDIDKMILVGHGFAASYALEHPSHVRHLVLVDPWGFVKKPVGEQSFSEPWIRFIGTFMSQFNALTFLRLIGQWAPLFLRIFRRDMVKRYKSVNPRAIHDYIYQCNAQSPTGETSFHNMTYEYGWPRRPMVDRYACAGYVVVFIFRFPAVNPRVPVTFICGSRSTINAEPFYAMQEQRENSYYLLAGHHVYADNPDEFNRVMAEISELVDLDRDQESTNRTSKSSSH